MPPPVRGFTSALSDTERRARDLEAALSRSKALRAIEFAKARSIEIYSATEMVKETAETAGKSELLPHHLRRRQGSYNAYRRHKRRGVRDMTVSQERRWRRKPKLLLESRMRGDNGKPLWLETHLWLVKRMHMVTCWGFVLPERRRDRGVRAAYRSWRWACTLFDASFESLFELRGPVNVLRDAFSVNFQRRCPPSFAARMYTDGQRAGEFDLHSLSPDNSVVGPVAFLWCAAEPLGSKHRLWLWCHAAMAAALRSVLLHVVVNTADVEFDELCHAVRKFEVRGPNSLEVLGRATAAPDLLGVTDKLPGRHAVIAVDLVYSKVQSSFVAASAVPLATAALWDMPYRIAVRERMAAPTVLRRRPLPAPAGMQVAAAAHDVISIPVLLIHDGSGGADILLPAGCARAIWLKLVLSGAHTIGLAERRSNVLEGGDSSFPHDFVDTTIGRTVIINDAKIVHDARMRRPPKKRPPAIGMYADGCIVDRLYTVVGSAPLRVLRGDSLRAVLPLRPPPSASPDGTCELWPVATKSMALVRVLVRINGSTAFSRGSALCVPSDSDLSSTATRRDASKIRCIDGDRSVIGHVISVGYSYRNGLVVGVGFVLADALRQLRITNHPRTPPPAPAQLSKMLQCSVLVRSAASTRYRLGSLAIGCD